LPPRAAALFLRTRFGTAGALAAQGFLGDDDSTPTGKSE
jgi:hypothetical protein